VSAGDRAPDRVVTRSPAATVLLPRFLEHRRRDVAALRAAVECGDFETIRRLGHNMAGNGLSYGFPDMSAIGRRLEIEASAGNALGVSEQVTALEICLEHAEH